MILYSLLETPCSKGDTMKYRTLRRALSTLCTAALLLAALPAPLALPSSAAPDALTYTAEALYPPPAFDTHISSSVDGAMQARDTDVVGMQVVLTADAHAISTNVPSYSNNTGSATLALFAFDGDYDTSLLADPLAEHTFTDFHDDAYLTFTFAEDAPLSAGEYILLLYDLQDPTPGNGNGTGIGLWTCPAHEGQRTYFNGSYVSDRSHPVHVDYVTAPSTSFGIPTKPASSGDIDNAPHMAAVLDFRRESTMAAIGSGNSTKATYETESDEHFLRLRADKDAGDPYQFISLPETVIKCSEYKYLLLKARRSSGSVLQSQVFYITDQVSLSEAASVRPSYADTTDWQYIVINLGASGAYAGLLTGLRLDYYQTCSGKGDQWLDIQYMALFRSEDAARAFHDNFADFTAPAPPDTPDDSSETTPDYSTYTASDPAGEVTPGKLTENGQLGYLYREYTYTMDFTATPEAYMAEGAFAFSQLENAVVHNDALQCKAFSSYTFYTKNVLGDRYGMRGGTLSLDLVLTSGTVAITLRQIKPNDDIAYSGLCLELTSDGQLTVTDRDGFADSRDLGLDLSTPHRLAVTDTGDSITLSVDEKPVYTLLWDSFSQTLQTPEGDAHKSIHLPGSGFASFRATRTRGYVDNVRYTYTDIVPKTVEGSHPVDYTTWQATDDLDRTTPLDVGEPNGKQVGLFYFLIHSDDLSGRYVNDVTRFYLEGGTDYVAEKLSSFAGRNGAYWAEPYFGYYSSHDEWVYRKHAYMLSAAGVDFIFLDVSNNVFYVEQATILFDTWKSIRDEGGVTPQIAFMYGDMPFTLLNGLYTLLEPFYNNPDYQELLYRYNDKPLLLGNNDTPDKRTWTVSATTPQTRNDYRNRLKSDPALNEFYTNDYESVLERFTVRKCWAWQAGLHKGYWDWLQESPQAIGTDFDGKTEQIAVSMGVHAHTSRGRSYQNGNNTYNPNGQFGFTLGTAKYGLYFAEQFEYALKQDVNVVLITGWNEWYAGVQKAGSADQTCGQTPTPGYYMVDQMSPEYSRDGEPMKLRDGEGFGDNYYYQMVSYIRRFKGMNPPPATVNGGNLGGDTSAVSWERVAPAFTDTVGDADLRHALSFSAEFLYTGGSARNDLDVAKVSQDAEYIHFRITTATPLITVDDEFWMNLYIDADGDPSTGWEGFDYLLNRSRTDKTVSVERFVDGQWALAAVGEADYTCDELSMVISVKKSLLGHVKTDALSLNFKWADNARVEGDILRFMTEGDTAPNDRFVFAYTAASMEDERPTGEETAPDTIPEDPSATHPDLAPVPEAPSETAPTDSKKGCRSSFGVAMPLVLAAAWMLARKRNEPHIKPGA